MEQSPSSQIPFSEHSLQVNTSPETRCIVKLVGGLRDAEWGLQTRVCGCRGLHLGGGCYWGLGRAGTGLPARPRGVGSPGGQRRSRQRGLSGRSRSIACSEALVRPGACGLSNARDTPAPSVRSRPHEARPQSRSPAVARPVSGTALCNRVLEPHPPKTRRGPPRACVLGRGCAAQTLIQLKKCEVARTVPAKDQGLQTRTQRAH